MQTARRCLNFKGFNCDNQDCINESCPLNKVHQKVEIQNKGEKNAKL